MIETVIKLYPKLCVFLTQFLTPYSVFSYLAQIHDTYSNSEGMKAVTNVICKVGGGIVLFPWLSVVVGVVSKRKDDQKHNRVSTSRNSFLWHGVELATYKNLIVYIN